MTIYLCLAGYIVGLIALFILLILNDSLNEVEPDLSDALIRSFLWPFYVAAILGIAVRNFIEKITLHK